MKKIILLLILVVGNSYHAISQSVLEKEGDTPKTSTYYMEVGALSSSFQDVKFSNVQYTGVGARFKFGFEKAKNSIWGINLELNYSNEKAETHSKGDAIAINAVLSVKYLYPILKTEKQKFYIGGTWSIIDLYFRQIEGLDNSSIAYISNSGFKVSSIYERKISPKFKLEAGVDFQLFGFVKEAPGFAILGSRKMLTDGGFDYQDMNSLFPNNLKYYTPELFWEYMNVGTSIRLHYLKRWSLSYTWSFQRSNRINKYPLTKGYNAISIRYNL